MKVILLKDVRNVGRRYDVKNVSEGFAMNSLIPQRLAEVATDSAVKKLEGLKKRDDEKRKASEEILSKEMGKLSGIEVVLEAKANEQGHLFAAVHADDIVEDVRKQSGLDIGAEHIAFAKPIKEVGEHQAEIRVGEKSATFKVVVKAA